MIIISADVWGSYKATTRKRGRGNCFTVSLLGQGISITRRSNGDMVNSPAEYQNIDGLQQSSAANFKVYKYKETSPPLPSSTCRRKKERGGAGGTLS